MKRTSTVLLVPLLLAACGDTDAAETPAQTQTLTPIELGFQMPKPAPRTLGVHKIRSGMSVTEMQRAFDPADTKIDVRTREGSDYTRKVNGVPYQLKVPIPSHEIATRSTFRNTHPDRSGASPDADHQSMSIKVWGDNLIESISFENTWSDQHHLGIPLRAVAQKINQDYGQPLIEPTDGLNLSYCFDDAGKQVMPGYCNGDENLSVRIEAQTCTDPQTAGSMTQRGNPMYDGLVCTLSISYHDNRIRKAFDKDLAGRAYAKFIALYGQPDQ